MREVDYHTLYVDAMRIITIDSLILVQFAALKGVYMSCQNNMAVTMVTV